MQKQKTNSKSVAGTRSRPTQMRRKELTQVSDAVCISLIMQKNGSVWGVSRYIDTYSENLIICRVFCIAFGKTG